MKIIMRAAVLLALEVCSACAPLVELQPGDVPPLPESTYNAVEHIPQTEYHCGPAALAMMLRHSGIDASYERVSEAVYTPERFGSLQADMKAAARRWSRAAYNIEPELGALLEEAAAGRPVLVLLNKGLRWLPIWHYAIVVGYDLPENRIILTSGRERQAGYSIAAFSAVWKRAENWGLLVLRPGELPVRLAAEKLLQAAGGLERVHKWQAAAAVYRSLLEREPKNRFALVGLGAALIQSGRYEEASDVLESGLLEFPDLVPLLNNLAEVRAAQGRSADALALARRAAALGGPHQAAAKRTLRRLEQRFGNTRAPEGGRSLR